MKPFDLEKAKVGHPVCTRDGEQVRILCFNKEGNDFPIVALIKKGLVESTIAYTIDGNYYSSENLCGLDLFMVSEEKKGWTNIYKCKFPPNTEDYRACDIYKSKEEAIKQIDPKGIYIDTVEVNWEE